MLQSRKIKMELANRIKWNMTDDETVVWKYPSEEILIGSQLIVSEGQEAIFVKGGEILDRFNAGTHTIISANIPILNRIVNLPFDGKTPFTAEIWFIRKLKKMNLKWGTRSPIQIMDPNLGMPVSVRSFGRWGFQVTRAGRLLKQIVGNNVTMKASQIDDYLYGIIIQSITESVADHITNSHASILNISNRLTELSSETLVKLSNRSETLGIVFCNFDIESINIPEDELATFKNVFIRTLEARELSKTDLTPAYAQIKSFEILQTAAANEKNSEISAMLGAGIGFGASFPVGQRMGEKIAGSVNEQTNSESRLKQAKSLFDEGLITQAQFDDIRNRIIREL